MKRYLLLTIFLCWCSTAPSDVTLHSYDHSSVTVQCEDEHEPVLTVAENHTVGIVTCVKK